MRSVWFNGGPKMAVRSDRRIVGGVILIVVGAGLLALQLFDGLGRSTWPLMVGALFLVGYFVRRTYGFLIAGSILFGIGLGQLGEEIFDVGDGIETIGLGLGFVSIYLIDRIDRADAPWWPLIPGLILLASGLGSVGGAIANVMDYVWPGLLILVGLALIFGLSRSRQSD